MNKRNFNIENTNENKIWIRNFSVSIFLHLLFIAVFIYLYGLQTDKAKINSMFFTIDTKEFVNPKADLIDKQFDDFTNQKQELPDKQNSETTEQLKTITFSDIIADTTNLDQVYTEATLNVSIKYPKGWMFIDQNKKKKLDGVTFWANDGLYNPPPYIHLEVIDKDMFIEKRYRFKMEFDKYDAFYNDPEEMQGYITQSIYIRTNKNEDFKLKLMMKGKKNFDLFQPKFWAMLKTFDFGSGVF